MEQFQNLIGPDYDELTKGVNMLSIFSLAKSKNAVVKTSAQAEDSLAS